MTSSTTDLQRKSSLNQIPALFKLMKEVGAWEEVYRNLDWGAGKYDTASEWLYENCDVNNIKYDPLNRTEENNKSELSYSRRHSVQTVTLSNVLNVLDYQERGLCLQNLKSKWPSALASLWVSVYVPGKTKHSQVQQNMKLEDYLPQIKEYFPNMVFEVVSKGGRRALHGIPVLPDLKYKIFGSIERLARDAYISLINERSAQIVEMCVRDGQKIEAIKHMRTMFLKHYGKTSSLFETKLLLDLCTLDGDRFNNDRWRLTAEETVTAYEGLLNAEGSDVLRHMNIPERIQVASKGDRTIYELILVKKLGDSKD